MQPQQFYPQRIKRADVQNLMRKVKVHPPVRIEKPRKLVEKIDPYSRNYPDMMPCRIEVKLNGGRKIWIEKTDYSGFKTKPWGWEEVIDKFSRLAHKTSASRRERIIETVKKLEKSSAKELMKLLGDGSRGRQ